MSIGEFAATSSWVDLIKGWVRQTHLYRLRSALAARKALSEWRALGQPAPPPHAIKSRNLLALADIFGTTTLVETGSCCGDMLEAARHQFKELHSIELDPRLARQTRIRFAGVPHVHVHEGDSAELLPGILAGLNVAHPVLFWLDGHYSGPGTASGTSATPILAELRAIAEARPDSRDVILIDDARLFGSDPDYPSQEGVRKLIGEGRSLIATGSDALLVLPPAAGA